MQEFRIFLDGVEFFDIPEEVKFFEEKLSRIKEDDEMIYRIVNESELTFRGDCYKYICQKRIQDLCSNIDIKILNWCNSEYATLFDGVYKNSIATHFPNEKKIKSKLYENNYSSMLLERVNNNIYLNVTKSINGVEIGLCPYEDVQFFDNSGDDLKKVRIWRVREVFKWLIRYFTDDKIGFNSDFLMIENHAITTGAMLRNGATGGVAPTNTFQNTYSIPNITYAELFKEIRKLMRIYSATEDGTIKIEQENYFFQSNIIFELDELPLGTEEEFYTDELYSQLNIGATDNRTDTGVNFTPNLRLYGTEQETYNNCNNCVIDNQLDLVNDWIINSNIIHECLLNVTEVWDNKIVVIEMDGAVPAKYQETNGIDGSNDFYYNEKFNNINKMVFWEGGIPICVNNLYNQEPCMNLLYNPADDITIYHEQNDGQDGVTNTMLRFSDVDCDAILMANNSYDSQFIGLFDNFAISVPLNNNSSGAGTVVVIPFNGVYKFETQINFTNILQVNGGSAMQLGEEYKIELKIIVLRAGYAKLESGDNAVVPDFEFSVQYLETGDFETPFNETLTVVTTDMNLNAGAVVLPIVRIKTRKIGLNIVDGDAIEINSGYMTMLNADYDFITNIPVSTVEQRKIQIKLKYPLCCSEFNNIVSNKYGIIKVAGKDAWINELKYINNKVSEFSLILRDTFCTENC